MTRTIIARSVGIAVLVPLTVVGLRHLNGMAVATHLAKRQVPFTAHVFIQHYSLSTGSPGVSFSEINAFSADGSSSKTRLMTRDEVNGPVSKGEPATQRIVNPAAQTDVIVNHRVKAVTTTYMHQVSLGGDDSCDTDRNAPTKLIDGYQVRLKRVSTTSPDLSMRAEEWRAPKLNCFTLSKTLYMSRDGGLEVAVAKQRVERLDLGEPDRSLFSIPQNYKEMRPSEVLEAEHRLRLIAHPGVAGVDQQEFRNLDRSYMSRRHASAAQ